MSIEIKLPDIGSDEVEVTEILVKVGDKVEVDQSLLTVEGDKASMEIPAPQAGIVKSISVKVGDKVKTGVDIMVFDTENGAESAPAQAESAPKVDVAPAAATVSQTVDVNVPDIGGDEVEVTEILVKVGDTISVDDSLITVEGDKASMEIPASIAGVVKTITVKVGDKVKTGSKIMEFETASSSAPANAATATPAPTAPEKSASVAAPVSNVSTPAATASTTASNDFVENDAYAHATPSVRRLAREFGVNLAKVSPTGPKNRILREDIQAYVKNAVKQVESGTACGALPGLLPWPKVDFSKFGETETLPLTKIQKVSGANLHRNWVMIPHVTEFDETDITDLEAFRKQQNAEAEKKKLDLKITPLVFIMKAVASALTAYPRFNSSLSEDAQTLIIKKYINIGVAVDTPNGLVVPVFKDVNKKGIVELSRELAEISKKAREGKLTGADMQGGCFTISSLGGIGTTSFTPIVNAPEVGILGVSRSSMKPVWNGKEFTPRLMLPLSLSFDHRVIDGADGARFLSHIVNVLSDLRRLVM
ncbi:MULTISPECIES: pyruvate dehydrogenase complex dihydrolipoyllysine-residue acetyltransferase [unclassified Gilliamella]|uniref:pyruvate dehydrogenase complex dihydrolipoyllysine-residue acetyltransferase n=1 Tax=unclassified Gilliamella TaxID=2685620 RepID=UPI003A5CFFC1|nr:pyruvate dehydrogenase complex dihydrolipoyllysine-residue acetyltransferase [Gilliamella sp. B3831]MCX8575964.1 pyruvate dehydrogenase complex dihydrolipoyllysine-residue acetyltransferase [Gilliamella sp. B3815]MCX8589472.1 pyruvate dehydrogenase complex dihydrolipoyllysine-residue acetyltransferase [Gilliamella sp. B3812]MCX8603066.1 pyruvate dehydrogenase complex dihydrolipoyllysine-residue acetyltransferase [Gilliamella sp. B3823]MCX8606815.1 pyruvate dehydrogenase complex dihydrolipoyl